MTLHSSLCDAAPWGAPWPWRPVQRLELQRLLERHTGCVNTCSFSPDGSSLVTGSDDRQIIIWDWEVGQPAHNALDPSPLHVSAYGGETCSPVQVH